MEKIKVDILIRGDLMNKKCERCYENILLRTTSPKCKEEHPSYVSATICEEWENYENFKKWFYENYVEGYQIDKDILFKGNKEYAPDKCCFVPGFINSLFTKSDKKRGCLPIGVDFHKGKYRARCRKKVNGVRKRIEIGCFNTIEEAFQAYKTERERYIKEVADQYKGCISQNVYESMYNYKVEIDD